VHRVYRVGGVPAAVLPAVGFTDGPWWRLVDGLEPKPNGWHQQNVVAAAIPAHEVGDRHVVIRCPESW
jgi:hypothetical protein